MNTTKRASRKSYTTTETLAIITQMDTARQSGRKNALIKRSETLAKRFDRSPAAIRIKYGRLLGFYN